MKEYEPNPLPDKEPSLRDPGIHWSAAIFIPLSTICMGILIGLIMRG